MNNSEPTLNQIDKLTEQITMLTQVVNDMKAEMWTRQTLDEHVNNVVDEKLKAYSKTDAIVKMVVDHIAPVSRSVRDMSTDVKNGFDKLNTNFVTFSEEFRKRISDNEHTIGNTTRDMKTLSETVRVYQEAVTEAKFDRKGMAEDIKQMLTLMNGDVGAHGFATRIQIIENTMPVLQTSITDVAKQQAASHDLLTQREQRDLEKRDQWEKRKAMLTRFAKWLPVVLPSAGAIGAVVSELIRVILLAV